MTTMGLFDLSYAALWGLVLLQALLLQEIVREAVWLKRLVHDFGRKRDRLPTGTPVPDFTAPVLDGDRVFRARQLAGGETILLFVEPSAAASPVYASLDDGIHGLWHKAEGRLLLVCRGSAEECRRLVADRPFQVPVLVDEGGQIAASFLVSATPTAVGLDAEGRIASYGRPISAEQARAADEARKARQARGTGAPLLELPAPESGE